MSLLLRRRASWCHLCIDPWQGAGYSLDAEWYADQSGQIMMSLVSARCRRGVGCMSDQPQHMVAALAGPHNADTVISACLHDALVWKVFQRDAGKCAVGRGIMKMQCMPLV